ncbi:hypothetical protein [Rubrolithibacter danxiaensis]|uniref:hypothetical protein n=1 Tax=Rubrolithibacter danxiaensis TaxID=3390805 RepID=UPI003BF80798
MFTNITWTNYFIVIILLLTIYYLFVGIWFYYQDLKNLVDKRKLQVTPDLNKPLSCYSNNTKLDQSESFENSVQSTEDNPFQEVEHLVSRLKEAVKDASDKKALKQEFSQYLYLILKEYPALKISPFQSAINELITSECAKYGSIILSEDEVVKLWNEV